MCQLAFDQALSMSFSELIMGMDINAEKTKIMTNSTNGITKEIKVEGQKLESVKKENSKRLFLKYKICIFLNLKRLSSLTELFRFFLLMILNNLVPLLIRNIVTVQTALHTYAKASTYTLSVSGSAAV